MAKPRLRIRRRAVFFSRGVSRGFRRCRVGCDAGRMTVSKHGRVRRRGKGGPWSSVLGMGEGIVLLYSVCMWARGVPRLIISNSSSISGRFIFPFWHVNYHVTLLVRVRNVDREISFSTRRATILGIYTIQTVILSLSREHSKTTSGASGYAAG